MIRTLLAGAIDYAGLFPPAGQGMDDAVRRYAGYRAGQDAWALGRFVVPAARLGELGDAARRVVGAGTSWPLSAVLGAGGASELARVRVDGCTAGAVESIEARAGSSDEVHALHDAAEGIVTFVEVGLDDAMDSVLDAVAGAAMAAKVRTGGTTPTQFPSAAALARFMTGCASRGIPFKATAGLHHPVRGEYALTYDADSASATMFGFLNLFAAATCAHEGQPVATVQRMLETREVAPLVAVLHDASSLAHARSTFALSFGSCSFEEPLEDLRQLGLLT